MTVSLRRSLSSFLLLFCFFAVARVKAHADDFPPLSPDELKMKADPKAPGAPAVVLFREYETDENEATETQYKRIKILAEDGKKFANVEIPFDRGYFHFVMLKGRTIHPDGSVVEFDGKSYDKTVYKQGKIKVQVKTFSLPDVTVGSVVEYKYKLKWDGNVLYEPRWLVQDEVFEHDAKFRYIPFQGDVTTGNSLYNASLQWTTVLPDNSPQPKRKGLSKSSTIELELTDVPEFVKEDFAPPEEAMQQKVEFFYIDGDIRSADQYWDRRGKIWSGDVEKFAGAKKQVAKIAAEAVAGESDPEKKLRKLYDRVQQVRNLNYEHGLSSAEAEKLNPKNADEVFAKNAGFSSDIARAFLAMARTQGFEAYMADVARRDQTFFEKNIPSMYQLRHELVIVNVNGKERFFDPGTKYAPFGLLSWKYTASAGIRQVKKGIDFVKTPAPEVTDAETLRAGKFELSPAGDLAGTLDVTFSGQEALEKRLEDSNSDDAGRTKDLEDEVKRWMPAGANVKLAKVSGWTSTNEPLVAEFHIEAPGFASATGKRLVLPTGLFQAAGHDLFTHSERKQPIYFPYPYSEKDDIAITLPQGVQVESVPQSHPYSLNYADYKWERAANGNTLNLKRDFALKLVGFRAQDYEVLKTFFDMMKQNDDTQAILKVASNAGGN